MTEEMLKKTDEFLENHPKGHFLQSRAWAKVKPDWTQEIIISTDKDGEIKGAMTVLIRQLPFFKKSIMYAARGPVCDVHDRETIKELLDKAKILAKRYKAYVLKIDPDVLVSDTEFENILKELGCTVTRNTENYGGLQPRFVFRLNIENKTEEELLNSFHSKTRYNIRLSARKGVTVREGKTKEDTKIFHDLITVTGKRDGFIVRTLEYYQSVLDNMGDKAKLFMAYHEDKCIAATIAICYGDKCWYLYGASANEHRNLMPNYQLQWSMIKWALENKCRIYDFRGVPGNLSEDNPMIGLYRFKVGFNGDYTEFIGMVEDIYDKGTYFLAERAMKTFKTVRHNLFVALKGDKR